MHCIALLSPFQIQPTYLPQPRCHYVNETECVTETRNVCQPEAKQVCVEVNESVCEEIEEEACTEVTTQKCVEEEKTACTNFVTQECKEEPGEPREEEVCQDAVIEECVGFEIQTCEVAVEDDCRNVTSTVCSPSTRSVLDLEIGRWVIIRDANSGGGNKRCQSGKNQTALVIMTHGYFCLIEKWSLRQWGHAIIFSKACSHYDVIVSRVTIISTFLFQ